MLRIVWALAAALSLAPEAASASFSDVFFFGDSLSDTGNVCVVLQIAGYAPGRCSNGPVWSDGVAAALGFEARPSSQSGNNFANGGDTTADLDLQITEFRLLQVDFLGNADPDALYVIWLGGNDVLAMPSHPQAMADAVNNILAGIERLQSFGAFHFLVAGLPDVGRVYGSFSFPQGSGLVFTPAERDRVTVLSVEFNGLLAAELDLLSGGNVFRLDVFRLLEDVIADPPAFGFAPGAIDTTSDDTAFGVPCLSDAACLADPQGPVADTFVLFDSIHPTAALHALIAERAAILLPEPSPLVLRSTALLVVLALGRLASRRPVTAEVPWRPGRESNPRPVA